MLRFGSKGGVLSSIVALSRRIKASSALNNMYDKFGVAYLGVSIYFRPLIWPNFHLLVILLVFVKSPRGHLLPAGSWAMDTRKDQGTTWERQTGTASGGMLNSPIWFSLLPNGTPKSLLILRFFH